MGCLVVDIKILQLEGALIHIFSWVIIYTNSKWYFGVIKLDADEAKSKLLKGGRIFTTIRRQVGKYSFN